MKKSKIKLLCFAPLAALLLVSCGKEKIEDIKYLEYNNNKNLFLSAYLSPNRMEEKYFTWAKEANLTHLYIDYYTEATESTSGIMSKSLQFCDNVGLKTIPMANWGSTSYHSWSEHPLIDSMESHPSFDGFNILDEPVYEDFDLLKNEVEAYYQKYSTNRPFYTNLLRPGNPKSGFSKAKDKSYDDYINGFIDKVIKPIKAKNIKPIMSQTLYPMMNETTGEKYIMDSHLTDLARFQKEADAVGATKYHFVQTVSFGNNHHTTNEAEIRFQIYCGLAFGFDGFQYFTYWTPNSQGGEFQNRDYAMIDRSLNRSEEYYGVQAVNEEILKIQNVLLSFEYKGLILVDGKTSTSKAAPFEFYRDNINFETLDKTDNLSVVSASQDTLISYMKDENNNDGYMVVNYSLPTDEKKDNVLLSIPKAKAVMVFINGEEQRIPANSENFKKGVLSLNLNEGQGALVIPIF